MARFSLKTVFSGLIALASFAGMVEALPVLTIGECLWWWLESSMAVRQ